MTAAPTTPAPTVAAPGLNPVQQRTVSDVLGLGGPRPETRPGLVQDLRALIADGTRTAMGQWNEKSLFLSKSQLGNLTRCEGLYEATKKQPRTRGMFPAVAKGLLVHRALQHCHTHPRATVEANVRSAVEGCFRDDAEFVTFWRAQDPAAQSDLLVEATNMVMTFLDSWPPILDTWSPRYEFGMQARIERITLSGRTDLVLGRPRPDQRQSMVIVDWKSGSLYPEHDREAAFYALLATLRFGVPPFRSFIYSLSSAETTQTDVDEDRLFGAAQHVVDAVNAIVEVMGGHRAPTLTPSSSCGWCPVKDTCPAAQSLEATQLDPVTAH